MARVWALFVMGIGTGAVWIKEGAPRTYLTNLLLTPGSNVQPEFTMAAHVVKVP